MPTLFYSPEIPMAGTASPGKPGVIFLFKKSAFYGKIPFTEKNRSKSSATPRIASSTAFLPHFSNTHLIMALNLKTAVWTVLFLLGWALSAQGDIYRYIDSNGVLHFTNVPVSSGYQVYLKEKSHEPADVYELKTALRSQPPITHLGSTGTDRFDRYIFQASRKHDISF